LLDEPERALGVQMQRDLFEMLIDISKSCQVIVATHSPFWLQLDDLTVIDVIPGYIDQTKQALKQLTQNL
jgi:predicted ATPase